MGGAYAYGLRRGRRRDTPLLAVEEQWEVLLPERHEGYVEWQEWLAIQEQLASNHSCRDGSRGPAREGPALLQGLVVCGHCGYAMAVDYNARGWSYGCNVVDPTSHQKRGCCSMGGKRLDREVVRVFLEMATPAGAEAAVRAATDVAERADADLRRWEQALEHCRYQAGLAERRYRQVDPDNRLIAATLEREWEAALVALQEAEQALAAARAEQPPPPAPEVFAELGSSLEAFCRAVDGRLILPIEGSFPIFSTSRGGAPPTAFLRGRSQTSLRGLSNSLSPVVAAAALGGSDMEPARSPVDGAGVARGLDEGLDEHQWLRVWCCSARSSRRAGGGG